MVDDASDAAEQIVGRERRERLSQLAWCGEGCFDSRRRVNSSVRCFIFDTSMRVLNHARLPSDAVADIAKELSTQENLKAVMAWALSAPPGTFFSSVVAEVIVHDEFTHDVIVPWRDGLVLVYDTT